MNLMQLDISKKTAYLGTFLALSLIISYVESQIPVFTAVPGVKLGIANVVIFSPEDLQLVKEGPSVRRRFLDMMLSQLSTPYFVALQTYTKCLEQRNSVLREGKISGRTDIALLESFEKTLVETAGVIIPERQKAIEKLGRIAAQKYLAISDRENEKFNLRYECCMGEEAFSKEGYERLLIAHRREDMARGTTSFGIHREDMILTLSGNEMKMTASQGQCRTAALSLKLSQLTLIREECGDTPVLLLDDVMSELDMTRRKKLLMEMKDVQTFVTCTDESDLEGASENRTYRVNMVDGKSYIEEKSAGGAYVVEEKSMEPDFT